MMPFPINVPRIYRLPQQYEEFVTIKGAIEGDARALDAACNNMMAACDASQHEIIASAANRSKYWQRMADSCSAIAEAYAPLPRAELGCLFCNISCREAVLLPPLHDFLPRDVLCLPGRATSTQCWQSECG